MRRVWLVGIASLALVLIIISLTVPVQLCVPPYGAVCVEGKASGDSCIAIDSSTRQPHGSACDALSTVPGKAGLWWAEQLPAVGFFETNVGSGLLFFVLEVVLIVFLVPFALAQRGMVTARRNWRATARNLAGDILALDRELAPQTLTEINNPADNPKFGYLLGYADEIQNSIIMMGRDMHAFPRLAGAVFELTPLLVRIRRRLTMITTGLADRENRSGGQVILLMGNANEFRQTVSRHRQFLESEAHGYHGRPH